MALNLSYEAIAKLLSNGSMERPNKKNHRKLLTIPSCSSWTGGNKGVELSHRTGDWATQIFREHNKEADRWAGYGAKGSED